MSTELFRLLHIAVRYTMVKYVKPLVDFFYFFKCEMWSIKCDISMQSKECCIDQLNQCDIFYCDLNKTSLQTHFF